MPRFLDSVDLNQTELKNARIHVLEGAPASPVESQIYYNNLTNTPYIYDGAGWLPMVGEVRYRFAYDTNTVYSKGDFVTYNGSTYIVTTPTGSAGVVPTNDTMWDVLSESGVSSTSYTNATPMPIAFGGLPAGQTFDHMPITDVLNKWLYPYQSPGFASFSMSSGFPGSTIEVGTSVSGSKTFTWSTSNASNVQAGSVVIKQGATTIASGLNSSGSTTVTIPTVTNNSPASQTWSITGTNTNGITFTTSFSVTWQYKKFYGISASTTLNSAAIQALANGVLGSGAAGSYVFVAGNYKYLAVPASFAAVSSVKDGATLLAVAMASSTDNAFYDQGASTVPYGNVSVTNGLGVTSTYRVYRSRFELGSDITFVVA